MPPDSQLPAPPATPPTAEQDRRGRAPLALRLTLGTLGLAVSAFAALYAWQALAARTERRPTAALGHAAQLLLSPLGELRGPWVAYDVPVAAGLLALGCLLLYLGRWRLPAVLALVVGGNVTLAKPLVEPLRASSGTFWIYQPDAAVHTPYLLSGAALLVCGGLFALGLRLPGGRSLGSLFFGRARKVPYAMLPVALGALLIGVCLSNTDSEWSAHQPVLVGVALAFAGLVVAALRAPKTNPAVVAAALAFALFAKPALAPIVYLWPSSGTSTTEAYLDDSHLAAYLLPALPLALLAGVLLALARRARRRRGAGLGVEPPPDRAPGTLGGVGPLALQLGLVAAAMGFTATGAALAARSGPGAEALIAKVTVAHWQHAVRIARLQAVAGEGFAEKRPEKAFDVLEAGPRVHHHDTVCDRHGEEAYVEDVPDGERVEYYKERVRCGYDTKWKKCSKPGCTGGSYEMEDKWCDERRERRTPKFRSVHRSRTICVASHEEPRSLPWFTWKSMEWRHDRTWEAKGDDGHPRLPTAEELAPARPLAPGEEERQAPSASYRVTLTDSDGLEHVVVPSSPAELAAYPVGSYHRLRYDSAGKLSTTPLTPEAP